MKYLLASVVSLAGISLTIATSAQAITTSPVMICNEAIHSEFGVTTVQIERVQLPLIQGQGAQTAVQATVTESSLNQAPQLLGQYPVTIQESPEANAPAVYADTAGTFKLSVDVNGTQTLGGLTQATLEFLDQSGAPVTQGMVCQSVTQE